MASSPSPTPPQPLPLSIKTAARKLPVKRKTPDTPPSAHTIKSGLSPKPKPKPSCSSPVPNPIPKLEAANIIDSKELEGAARDDLKSAPFKFHRIWTESDEIRFLRSLLDCSGDGLVFPRDLPLFYDRFSQSIPQPYTKSQLSEKLRRLRKKFRTISTRISRGLDPSLLSPHDRALFALSKQLWHPSYASSSPFQSNKRNTSEVRVRFSPNPSAPAVQDPSSADVNDINIVEEDTELNLEYNRGSGQEHCLPLGDDCGSFSGSGGGGLGQFAAKAIMDVFDGSLKEVRMALVRRDLLYPDQRTTSTTAGSLKQGKAEDFDKRWREQRTAELDVLARRLRLVLENAKQ